MTKVSFPNGNEYSDDGTANRDLTNDGHRQWLVPMFGDVIELHKSDRATTARDEAQVAAATAQTAEDQAQGHAQDAANAIGSASNVLIPSTDHNLLPGATIVASFIYDTRQDSDGGAWRHKVNHLSWAQEPRPFGVWLGAQADESAARNAGGGDEDYYYDEANADFRKLTGSSGTAQIDRGARQGFPQVAYITAEAGRVVIWDGDDPDVPLFKTWNVTGATSAVAGQGVIVVGTGANGVVLIDLVRDQVARRDSTNGYQIADQSVADFDMSTVTWLDATGDGIVDDAANAVAATVLPQTPPDPQRLGLPTPTVIPFTDGGLSHIASDGSVYDVTRTGGYVDGWIDGNLIYAVAADGDVSVGPIPFADTNDSSWRDTELVQAAAPAVLGDVAATVRRSYGSPDGLTLTDYDAVEPANSGVVHVTKDYNTGWQYGNIRLALASVDPTDVSKSSIVNDDGSSSTGYTLGANWSHDTTNNEFDHTTGSTEPLDRSLSGMTDGVWCLAVVTVGNRTGGSVSFTLANATAQGDTTLSANGTALVQFQATGSSDTFKITPTSDFDGSVQALTVDHAEPDRSVKGNGAVIYNSLTKSPVASGADVVAWSGFSSINHLRVPYTPDFDFGTGDFSFTAWVIDSSGSGTMLHRAVSGTGISDKGILLGKTDSVWRFSIDDGTSLALVDGTTDANVTKPTLVIGVRRGNNLELWVNGRLENTVDVSGFNGLDDANAELFIGKRANSIGVLDGQVTLLRVAAYAPTPQQIKAVYEQERRLFEPNAKALLGGTSNNVRDLAYDPDGDRLVAATGDGTSVFHGLERTAHYATSDTAAAAAGPNGRLLLDARAIADSRNVERLIEEQRPLPVHDPSRFRVQGRTTDATADVAIGHVPVAEGERLTITARVQAVRGASASYQVLASVSRPIGGNVTLDGSSTTTVYESDTGLDATVTVDTGSQTAEIAVTGLASTTIGWTANVEVTRDV